MSRIVNKLNLNKTPQQVENTSLIFAKNIKLLKDGSIAPDTSLKEIESELGASRTYTVHHDEEVYWELDTQLYNYSILKEGAAVDYRINNVDPPVTQYFYFSTGGTTTFSSYISHDNLNTYVGRSSNNTAIIEVFIVSDLVNDFANAQPISNANDITFTLTNGNYLYSGKYKLGLAVRADIYDKSYEIQVRDNPDYILVGLNDNIYNYGATVIINGDTYMLINPVYVKDDGIEYKKVITPAYDEYLTRYEPLQYIAQIVGFNDTIYFFKEATQTEFEDAGLVYPTDDNDKYLRVRIFEFNEVSETFTLIKCGWRYSGGTIDGCVFKNNTNNTILSICEYDAGEDAKIPLKHINLDTCQEEDDESIYTQNPIIPITNLLFEDEYASPIPSGVYQFFVRYKINDYLYTDWFPCSKECYAGTKKKIATIQGELRYIDKHLDSDTSFIFSVKHLYGDKVNSNVYEKFQIGFILSKDDGAIIAREWKEFDFSQSSIYFSYNAADIKEANIDDFIKTSYELFNVGNIVNYKNKLYIANYEESDFNPDLATYAQGIKVKINIKTIEDNQNVMLLNKEVISTDGSDGSTKYLYIGLSNLPINTKWGYSPYFTLKQESQNTDPRGMYSTLPLVSTTNGLINRHVTSHTNTTINAVFIKNGNNWDYILADDGTVGYTSTWSSNKITLSGFQSADYVAAHVDSIFRNNIEYFDSSDNCWYLKVGNNYIPFQEYYIEYTVDEYIVKTQSFGSNSYKRTSTTYILKRDVIFNLTYLEKGILDSKPYATLLPYTGYNFYVHYVKNNGVATNGYLINSNPIQLNRYCSTPILEGGSVSGGGSITTNSGFVSGNAGVSDANTTYYTVYDDNGNVVYYKQGSAITKYEDDKYIMYPSFTNIKCPDGYVACFITVSKVNNNVCQLFDVKFANGVYTANCLELDTLIYSQINNLVIYDSANNVVSTTGKYYDSGNSENTNYFGKAGLLTWNDTQTDDGYEYHDANPNSDLFWLVLPNNNSDEQLIKLTPYIKLSSSAATYADNMQLNGIGTECAIKKLDTDTHDMYISGSDVYGIDRSNITRYNQPAIKLIDLPTTSTVINNTITEVGLEDVLQLRIDNTEYRIKSNFNLNYLTLNEDITQHIKTITHSDSSESTQNTSQLYFAVDSLTCSYIYNYESYYKEHTRKLYSKFNTTSQTRFDNTVRSSQTIGDEKINTFTFNSTDYYNVPVTRGIIVKLISIANSIYVHCEHALFKFSDNRTMSSDESDITLQENDVFNTGITEVFDAQYGYAGLQDKTQTLISYNSYVFYDGVTRNIYAVGGESQITSLNDSIQKIIDYVNPTDVQFVADEIHDRFFVNLINSNGNVCLSYNFITKAFVSIHDIGYKKGFHSRRHTYFVQDNFQDDDIIGWFIYKIVDNTPTTISVYNACYKKSLLSIPDMEDVTDTSKAVTNCVDVIVNQAYETIKVVNYLNWICAEIDSYGADSNFVAEENLQRKYGGDKLRIYSDETSTPLISLVDNNGDSKISNNVNGLNDPTSWQYPRYNCGIWSINYFRDVVNRNDVFNYKATKNKLQDYLKSHQERLNYIQDSSLIYGKYFVVRLLFNNHNFKLENITLNMNDYGKTK